MSIQGNTVGDSTPRADFAQTDSAKPDFIKNKPDIAAIKETADQAKNTAENHNHDSTYAAKSHKHSAADVGALPAAGGKMTGAVTLKGMYLTEGVDYGDSFPTSGLSAGRLFFIAADSDAAAELG